MSPCEAMAGTVSDRKGKGGARAARLLDIRVSHIIHRTRVRRSRPGGARAPGSVK